MEFFVIKLKFSHVKTVTCKIGARKSLIEYENCALHRTLSLSLKNFLYPAAYLANLIFRNQHITS